MDVSVIIPAYNEEAHVGQAIDSIECQMPAEFEYEIIVVDHGSIDQTTNVAVRHGATVLVLSDARTIAALRNHGVVNSSGRILVFLDADTTLQPGWRGQFSEVVASLGLTPFQVTGSNPTVPFGANWLQRSWFLPRRTDTSPTHIGAAHIITTRKLFDEIGGFPEQLETGEDLQFCLRAKKLGATLEARPKLGAVHNGLPSTLGEFFRREVWHGRGDWTTLATIASSRVALITVVFAFLHLLLLVSIFADSISDSTTLMALLLILAICVGSSITKFVHMGPIAIGTNSLIYYIYFLARSFSLFSSLINSQIVKHERHP